MMWFGIFVFTFISVAVTSSLAVLFPACLRSDASDKWIVFGVLVVFVFIVDFLFIGAAVTLYKKKKQQRKEEENRKKEVARRTEHRKELLSMLDSMELPVVESPNILLKQGETAYFEGEISLLITKNKAIGTQNSSSISYRAIKGVYVNTGSVSRKIYDDVTTEYRGILTITNIRISFLQDQNSFEVKLNQLTNISSDTETLVLQQGNKVYALSLQEADIYEKIIRKLCEAA